MSLFYQIRHIRSGLFYKPARHSYAPGPKHNFSKAGKTYKRVPSWDMIRRGKPMLPDGTLVSRIDLEVVVFETKEAHKVPLQ